MTMKPRHEHDCKHCRFVCSMTVPGKGVGDWYIHTPTDAPPEMCTVLCKFGTDGLTDTWTMPVGLLRADCLTTTGDGASAVSAMLVLAQHVLRLYEHGAPISKTEFLCALFAYGMERKAEGLQPMAFDADKLYAWYVESPKRFELTHRSVARHFPPSNI